VHTTCELPRGKKLPNTVDRAYCMTLHSSTARHEGGQHTRKHDRKAAGQHKLAVFSS
jgi:hypothetical protein